MRRGFCRSNDHLHTGESCDVSGLSNFSQELDRSFIHSQKANFIRLVSDQVDELKRKTAVSSKNQRGQLGRSSKGVRFGAARSRPGFCPEDCGSKNTLKVPTIYVTQNCGTSSEEPRTDYEGGEDDCNAPKSSTRLPLRRRFTGSKADKPKDDPCCPVKSDPCHPTTPDPCRSKKPDPCAPDPCAPDPCAPDPCLTLSGGVASRRRNRASPRGFVNECSDVASQLTSGLPPCPGQRQRSKYWCILLCLLLLLLLLAVLAYVFVIRGGGDSTSEICSPSTVRYVPY